MSLQDLVTSDLTLHCNVKITRRKALNFVCDREGVPLFSSHEVYQCFDWLLENDHFTFSICDGDRSIRVMIGRDTG